MTAYFLLRSRSGNLLLRIFFVGLCWLLAAVGHRGQAQTPIPVPPEEIEPQPRPPILPIPPEETEPQLLPPVDVPLDEDVPPVTPDPGSEIPGTITVQEFEIIGGTVFSRAELQQAIAEFTNANLTFAQLLQAAERITQLYLDQGYITSGAYIPSQELRGDTVTIQVVEGRIEEINVNVLEERLNPNYIRDRLALGTATPLNINDLQEALQLLQLNPLIESINADLTAGTQAGTNILDVTVTGAETFNMRVALNNNRNPSVGSFERRTEITEANLLGWGARASIAYSNTDGSDRAELSYTLPLNARNGTLSVNYSLADNYIVEAPFDPLDIEIDIRDLNITYAQPIIQKATPERSQELVLALSATRRASDSQVEGVETRIFAGADADGETRISALRFSQEWTQRERRQVLAARSQFSVGIDAFEATVNENAPDSQFFAWRGQLLYLLLLDATADASGGPTLLLRSDLQLATDSLLSLEQFALGGQFTVRGYRQNALLSDNGVLAAAEVRLPIAQAESLRSTLQVVPFVDFGYAWNTNRADPETDTLIGIGLGLLWQGENLSARLDFGIPLTDTDSVGDESTWQENGVYFQVEYNFNPF
ncbi:MAG: ShlB/FhaC/HecB family hemolysin secretion/activation protein [Cyanophyceae cyanobacterium]